MLLIKDAVALQGAAVGKALKSPYGFATFTLSNDLILIVFTISTITLIICFHFVNIMQKNAVPAQWLQHRYTLYL